MPTPRDDETRDEFISRCIPVVLEDGTAESQDQAVAVCNSMWENRGSEESAMKDSRGKEHKVLPSFVTKVDGDQGIVEHTVAVMGNVDMGNDRIHPGAFTKTIMERAGQIRVLDTHNSGSVLNIIGKPLALWEVDRGSLPADVLQRFPDATGALMARTQFLMDTPEGKGAFVRIRDGAVGEYSIGYDPLDVDFTEETVDGQSKSVRNLRQIRLWEYSAVPFGMNPATSTVSAKGDDAGDADPPRYVGKDDETEPPETEPEPEQKAGRVFSARNATRIRGAIANVQQALDDLDDMLAAAMPAQDEPDTDDEQAKAAPEPERDTGQTQAGPNDDEPPTSEAKEAGPGDSSPTKEEMLAEIEKYLGDIQTELSEVKRG